MAFWAAAMPTKVPSDSSSHSDQGPIDNLLLSINKMHTSIGKDSLSPRA